jgi:hypothetical protein
MKLVWQMDSFSTRDNYPLGAIMSSMQIATVKPQSNTGSLLLGTGLAFASLILVPAVATAIGLGPSVTGALRIALMKASSQAVGGSKNDCDTATTTACH